MITGNVYLERGAPVTALAAWNGTSNPDLPRLQALLPHVRLKAHGPRNVLIADTSTGRILGVRPFRGLHKCADPNTPTT